MICRRRNLIFVHIPKCGGSSLENMLWPGPKENRTTDDLWHGFVDKYNNQYQTGGLQHLTAQLIRQVVGKDVFDACYRFTICRDPISRSISQYNYLSSRGDLVNFLHLPKRYSFDHYLDAICKYTHVQWTPQVDFILDQDGSPLADVFKLEDIAKDFAPMAQKLGLDATEMVHENKGKTRQGLKTMLRLKPRALTRQKLTREQHEKLCVFYKDDFSFLGYSTTFAGAS